MEWQISMQRFVDILTDSGFKAVFGEQRNREVLMELLNAFLPQDRHVRNIEYSATELPGFTLSNKSVRLDLRCTGDDGRQFIVEVQCYRQSNLFRRCVLYASEVYAAGSKRGDMQEYDIPPVFFICLLGGDAKIADGDVPRPDGGFVREHTFRENDGGNVPDETIFCIFVELNRFNKSLDDCTGELDEWCYSMKHGKTMTEIPDRLKKEPFEQFFRACEIAMFNTDTKLSYEKDMITERDYYNIINTARKTGMSAGMERGLQKGLQRGMESGLKKGRAEGREEGLQRGMETGLKKGREEERINIAKSMKAMNISTNVIAKATGLSEAEVEEL